MVIRLVFSLFIFTFITANFVDTYKYNDYDVQQSNKNVMQKLLHTLDDNKYNKDKYKRRDVVDNFKNWNGRWMPDRPGDPKPPPKVFPKNQQYEYESVAELPEKMYWPEHWISNTPELSSEMHWPGRWMPEKPNNSKLPFKISLNNERNEYESITEFPHEMYMGHVSPECDDAKTNLTLDWDHTPSEYTCYGHNFMPRKITARIYCENIPKTYRAAHKCMNQKIEYDSIIPLYGPHRPLWPVYGEYKYVPKQRWLHSLEHGAIVMLYHPCANPSEVKRLKNLVSKCLWRHIITPYSYLEEDRVSNKSKLGVCLACKFFLFFNISICACACTRVYVCICRVRCNGYKFS
ncbi:PREDICTED: uncharacterized protein LOC108774724 isoform X1 [Cyphomyrmex costatus]|uniref:uncharacterized protein LOC108774724 isoform X1 n=1 Tax=Cyphomyrmex costatus TaxID=456900 RepID=UPI0008523159|nr:PREDICTED: uncharacterized protein LOC108774724 isoform X1 [Cyphomyrmex costatus]